MAPVHVTSEIGPLRAVLVHTPGRELVAVTPGNREDYLYDDIIDIDLAQREHRQLVAVLERFADVYEVRDLLTELVARPDVREFLVTRALEVVPSDALARRLAQLAPEDLVALMVECRLEEAGPIARALNEAGYALPPLPNLFFTRDVGIVIGAHSIIGSMRYGVRWTEELLIKALFRYHEKLENAGILYDGSEEKRNNYTLEGGDVHPIRPDLLVLGFSERSSPAALDHLCDVAFEHCGVTDVVVVVMPAERTAIHLDMIFTQLDRELCCVYPPHFVGPERLAVLHRRKKSKGVKEVPNFFAAMQAVDQPLEPIFCGGNNRTLQEREQWASACNFFAARPGVVIAYERNEATVCELEHGGFRGVSAAHLLPGEGGGKEGGGGAGGSPAAAWPWWTWRPRVRARDAVTASSRSRSRCSRAIGSPPPSRASSIPASRSRRSSPSSPASTPPRCATRPASRRSPIACSTTSPEPRSSPTTCASTGRSCWSSSSAHARSCSRVHGFARSAWHGGSSRPSSRAVSTPWRSSSGSRSSAATGLVRMRSPPRGSCSGW